MKIKKIIFPIIIIFVWMLLSRKLNPFILPSPVVVIKNFSESLLRIDFWASLSITALRAFVGVIFSLILGSITGIAFGCNSNIKAIFRPLIISLQATPVISWILLALIWMDKQFVPLFIVFITTFPMVILTLENGIEKSKDKWKELIIIYKIPLMKSINNIYIYEVKNYFFSSVSLIASMSVKATVMAEVIVKINSGIGSKMELAQRNIDTTELITWTIVVIILTLLLENKSNKLIKK